MTSILLTGPAIEPISLEETKTFLRIEHNDEDELIAALIAGARSHIEAQTQTALITQDWRVVLDAWPQRGLWRQFRRGPQRKGFAANTQTFRCFKYHHRCGSRRCVCDRCRALGQADLRRAPALPAITADLAGFWHRLGASGRGRQISCAQAGSRWSDNIIDRRVDGRSLKMKSNFGEVQSMWNKIKSWFKHSTTILWARIQVFIELVVASLMALASDPNVSSAIQSALQPKFISYYVIMIGLITEIARRRTVGKEQ
jgi:Phage gp6-like head-tail connector protein